jgi:dihydropyrimidine dehydrogenase (NADP+)
VHSLDSGSSLTCNNATAANFILKLANLAHLQEFMKQHDFSSIDDFRGTSLPFFTTHMELVRLQVSFL